MDDDYKKLRDKWYKKLKDEGFNDVEQSPDFLEKWDSFYFRSRFDPKRFADKQKYYDLATKFLSSYRFESERDRLIWQYHSEGYYEREIIKLLKQHNIHLTKTPIHYTIRDLAKIMLSQAPDDEDVFYDI